MSAASIGRGAVFEPEYLGHLHFRWRNGCRVKEGCRLGEEPGSARITLVVPQIVPYPLPLTSPPVPLEFRERCIREIAAESPLDVQVNLYLCRDALEALKRVLMPGSLIVIGARKRFWPTRERGLARKLRRLGHEVILNEME